MRIRSIMLAGLSVLTAAAADAAPRRAPTGGLGVVQSGGEAALILDGTIMPRPFGATLVDRLTVVDRFPLGASRTAWLVRGDGSEMCARQYLLIERVSGQQPDLSSIFGCDASVSGRVRGGVLRLSVVAPAQPPSELAWQHGTLEPADATAAAAQADVTCRVPDATPAQIDAALAAALPAHLRRNAGLKRASLSDSELQARVGDLACLSTWPGGDRLVASAATPLFASRTWGAAAFAALDRLAVAPDSPQDVRAAVRLFSGKMRYEVAAREPIV